MTMGRDHLTPAWEFAVDDAVTEIVWAKAPIASTSIKTCSAACCYSGTPMCCTQMECVIETTFAAMNRNEVGKAPPSSSPALRGREVS